MEAMFKAMTKQMWRGHTAAWVVLGVVLFGLGLGTYRIGCGAGWLPSAFHAFKLFTFAVSPALGGKTHACGDWIYLVAFAASAYTSLGIFLLAFKKLRNALDLRTSIHEEYILVFGLGDKAAAYIDSELNHDPSRQIVAVELDPNNPHIDKYRDLGVAVTIADARDPKFLETLNLHNTLHMVALTGSNIDNFEIALSVKSILSGSDTPPKNFYLRNDDPALSSLYRDGGLLDDTAHLIVHMFSMARNSARDLWLHHSIDGDGRNIIDSDQEIAIVVAGQSQLAVEVIGQIAELAHLPNENPVTIYCITPDTDSFRRTIEQQFTGIGRVPGLTLAYLSLDGEDPACYTDSVWHHIHLTHVVLACEHSRDNIAAATLLAERTYLEAIRAKAPYPRIHIAIYEDRMIAEQINANNDLFARFDTFAATHEMAGRRQIIDELYMRIAQRIHYGYADVYDPMQTFDDEGAILDRWHDIDHLGDRPSNQAQAYHIPLKLKAMGLISRPSDKPTAKLLRINRAALDAKIGKELARLGLDDAQLAAKTRQDSFDYFPTDFSTLTEKLIRAEHNRWNAYHFLRGWQHDTNKNKAIKHHNCLVPLSNLPEEMHYTVLYDLYSILYIPNLMASVGYELVEEASD
jgi:hypothetical protein